MDFGARLTARLAMRSATKSVSVKRTIGLGIDAHAHRDMFLSIADLDRSEAGPRRQRVRSAVTLCIT